MGRGLFPPLAQVGEERARLEEVYITVELAPGNRRKQKRRRKRCKRQRKKR